MDAHLDEGFRKYNHYRTTMGRVSRSAGSGELSLPEAVAALEATELGRDPAWLVHLAGVGYPAGSSQETLAAHVIYWAVFAASADRVVARQISDRLEAEFRVVYGDAPPPHKQTLSWLLGSVNSSTVQADATTH